MEAQRTRFKYILRLAIQPGFREDEKLRDMVEFCRQARIDDCMLFVNCEELNRGHLTREETLPWLDLIQRAKQMLAPRGVTVSINPWITLLHTDRGRTLRPDQKFTLMVDPNGRQATAVACPLCPEWRAYMTEMYALYATLHPHMLWVEDDFRLHNHAPLAWGGCFCARHMEEFSRRAEHPVAREEFVKGLLIPGPPHPYRNIWLDCARETMAEVAAMIGEAVHKVSPETRVGLMSSAPAAHCAEGRDWDAILGGLAGPDTPMVNRPHLPAYQGVTGQEYLWRFSAISQLTRACAPDGTEIYPEIESFPPDTRYSKSHAFTRLQLETSALLESRGITLNIFDMMGNGVMLSEGFQNVLSQAKPFMESLSALNLSGASRTGVKVLFSPRSSYTLHTRHGGNMGELYPDETFWASMLSVLGIANTYHTGEVPGGGVAAVSGQYFRNLDVASLRALFEGNFVILDGEAAFTLWDMGCGGLAGIEHAVWHGQDSGFQAYEQVCAAEPICGLREPRISSQVSSGDFLDVTYGGSPEVLSVVKNAWDQVVAPGCVRCEGRVLIFPYGRFTGGCLAHINPIRRHMVQNVLRAATGLQRPAFVLDAPYVNVQSYAQDAKTVLLLTNFSDDDAQTVNVCLPGVCITGAARTGRDGTRTLAVPPDAGDTLSAGPLARWETAAVVVTTHPAG